MPIRPGIRIDPSKLGISQDPAGDRRRLLEQSQYSAQSKIDAARTADLDNGAGALRIRQRLNERGLYLSMADLMGVPSQGPAIDRHSAFQGMDTTGMSGMLTEEFPTNHDNRITEELYHHDDYHQPQPQRRSGNQIRDIPEPRARALPSAPQRQSLREEIIGGSRQQQPAGNWMVKAFLGETKTGKQVPVWKVGNAKTGTTFGKLFKIEGLAKKIVGYLNESGDSNDPRALSLMHAYEKREQLLKQARLLEQTAAGKPMKTEQLKAMYREIGQLDSRLGV